RPARHGHEDPLRREARAGDRQRPGGDGAHAHRPRRLARADAGRVRLHAADRRLPGAPRGLLLLPRAGLGAGPQRTRHAHVEAVHTMTTVTLYGRDGCHLCDDARAALARVQATTPFELVEVDIESDDELHRRYLERIPVIALDGEEIFDYFV